MTTLLRRRPLILLLLVAVVALGACSSGSKTGDESVLQFDQDQAQKLGGSTTTTAAAAEATTTTAATATTVKNAPTTTTAPRATTTLPPEKQEVTIEVAINEQSPYFEPSVVQVLVGSKVRFTNKGTKPHSVVSDTGAFDSGQIAPGAVWIFEADRAGRYNYSDGGRPFAVGSIEVQ
jgi:plastocyanin